MRRDLVSANGIELSYFAVGPADARPVVLVHGGGRAADDWSAVVQDLETEYRVHSFDARGHGASSWRGPYGYDVMARDADGFVAALGLCDVVLIGHSMGAGAAVLAAQRQPEWLTALVVEEPALLYSRGQDIALSDPPEEPTIDAANMVPAMIAQRNNPDPDWWNDLARVRVPTLLYVGARELNENRRWMHSAAELIPDCRTVTIPVGHDIHNDAPDEFLAGLRSFLT